MEAEEYFEKGYELHQQGILDEAVEMFRHAVLLKPDFERAKKNLILCLKAKLYGEDTIRIVRHLLKRKYCKNTKKAELTGSLPKTDRILETIINTPVIFSSHFSNLNNKKIEVYEKDKTVSIGGRYIGHKIGEGGFGVVYLCVDLKSLKVVAMKTLKHDSGNEITDKNTDQKNRLQKYEAFNLLNLKKHPHLISVVTVEYLNIKDEKNDRLFILSDYITPDRYGRNTLAHYLKGKIPFKRALIWGIQFSSGMEHAALCNIAPHSDIKPENIYITADGILKIADFGLARIFEHEINKEEIVEWKEKNTFLNVYEGKILGGTLLYMPHEQFNGKSDIRSDIYSFGLVLYEMINNSLDVLDAYESNKNPYYKEWLKVCAESANVLDVLKAMEKIHSEGKVDSIDSEMMSIISKCLNKEPDDRYQNFTELKIDFLDLYKRIYGKDAELSFSTKEQELENYYSWAGGFYTLGSYDLAIKEYRKVISLDPDNAKGYIGLGVCLMEQNHIDEAMEQLKHAVELDPANPHIIFRVAMCYEKKGQSDEAIREYRRVKHMIFDLFENLTSDIFKEAFKADNSGRKALLFIGRCLFENNKIDEAIKELKDSLRLTPEYAAETHFWLGMCFRKKELPEEAVKEFEEAISLNSEMFEALAENLD